MDTLPTTYFSNSTEQLFHALKNRLFLQPGTPFTRRFIIVPSAAMKSWLMMQLATDPDLNIAMGLEIYYIDQAIDKLQGLISPSSHQDICPSRLQLALTLEGMIRAQISDLSNCDPAIRQLWQPVCAYLKVTDPAQFSRKSERRLTTLSEQLAHLFMRYGVHGGSVVTEWKPVDSWQQSLWLQLFDNDSPWTYPSKIVSEHMTNTLTLPRDDIEVYLFACSYIIPIHHRLLLFLAEKISVSYYMLSPCHAFWSDILSDRESRYLQKHLQKRGISPKQQSALEGFLSDRHPLLANCGKVGREMARQIEESNMETEALYILPKAISLYPEYAEVLTDEIQLSDQESPLSLLEAVQSDMVLLRDLKSDQKVLFTKVDDSIQVHMAHAPMREIEIVYNVLMGIIHRHSKDASPIYPGDIIVMAPNIVEYTSYIKAVFGADDSALVPHIMDAGSLDDSLLIQGFSHLLSLPFGRWDAACILKLFSYSAFIKKQQLSEEDVRTLKAWIELTDVRWGTSAQQRSEVLQRDHCRYGMIDNAPIGTWEYAIKQLLFSLAVSEEHSSQPNVDAVQGPLLGKWIQLMRSLQADVRVLNDGTQLTASAWADYLDCLFDTYFYNDEEGDAHERLLSLINEFRKVGHPILPNQAYPFSTIRHHFLTALNKDQTSKSGHNLQSVQFCSMLPMRAIPAKVVVIIGMHDGAYPRYDPLTSLDLVQGNAKADYIPSQTDYDRFLFLEALLSARCYFLMTYSNISVDDGKEQAPALLVTELLSYLDKTYGYNQCVYKHPFNSYDCSYFGGNFCSYIPKDYAAAQAFYHVEKAAPSGFIPSFHIATDSKQPLESTVIHLKDLAAFAKNPIKSYFNKTLGMYLNKAEDRLNKEEEDFHLSSLQRYLLKKDALKLPLDDILQQSNREGKLPLGAFKGVAIEKIKDEISTLKNNLHAFGVLPEEIFSMHLSTQYQQPHQTVEGNWNIPALIIPYGNQQVHIVGSFAEVCPQGIIEHYKDDKIDIAKVWPQFLVFNALLKTHPFSIKNHLLLTKSDKGKPKEPFSDPFVLLGHYLDYYFTAQKNLSPLIPEWVNHLTTQSSETFAISMRSSLENPFKPLYNDYLQWTLQQSILPDAHTLVTHWQPIAKQLFEDLYHHWYPTKKGSGADV